MKKSRITLPFVFAMMLMAAVLTTQTQSASALPSGCQFTTANLKWQDLTTRESYSNAAAGAFSAWYATSTPLVFTKVTSGTNIKVTDANLGPGTTLGVTDQLCSGGYNVVAPEITLNRYNTDAFTSTKRKYVFVHEIGHALGLAHTSAASCPNIQIMHFNDAAFDVCRYSTPQSGDVAVINDMY